MLEPNKGLEPLQVDDTSSTRLLVCRDQLRPIREVPIVANAARMTLVGDQQEPCQIVSTIAERPDLPVDHGANRIGSAQHVAESPVAVEDRCVERCRNGLEQSRGHRFGTRSKLLINGPKGPRPAIDFRMEIDDRLAVKGAGSGVDCMKACRHSRGREGSRPNLRRRCVRWRR